MKSITQSTLFTAILLTCDEYTQNLLQMIYLYQERYSSHDPEIQALAEEID